MTGLLFRRGERFVTRGDRIGAMSPVQLRVLRGDVLVQSLVLSSSPVRIGRAPGNDVVLVDPAVSAQHAAVWVDGSGVWVADHGSRNGTFLNGTLVRGAARLAQGDEVRVGPIILKVDGSAPDPARAFVVEDVAAGVRFPVKGGRFVVGADRTADITLPQGDGWEAVLFFRGSREIWMAHPDGEGALEVGQTFVVAGRELRVLEVDGAVGPTIVDNDLLPYTLEATLNGPTGPQATLLDPSTGRRHCIDTDNRAVLVYVLVRQVCNDRAAGLSGADEGWCSDEAVTHGVWGRQTDTETNNLHVLVHRLRKEIERAGFDPWFIEKRRRAIRIRLPTVRVY
jgi:hypothetical protein